MTNINDPRYVKALSHPLRVRILALLQERTASPRELAEWLDATLGTVSYHVRTLHDFGLIELVKTTQVRGAIAHHYKAKVRPRVSDEAWASARADRQAGGGRCRAADGRRLRPRVGGRRRLRPRRGASVAARTCGWTPRAGSRRPGRARSCSASSTGSRRRAAQAPRQGSARRRRLRRRARAAAVRRHPAQRARARGARRAARRRRARGGGARRPPRTQPDPQVEPEGRPDGRSAGALP